MRFKIKLVYQSKEEKKLIIYQKGSTKIGEFKQYLQQQFQINSPSLCIEEYELFDNDSLSDVVKANEILKVIETNQQCNQEFQVTQVVAQKNRQINQEDNLIKQTKSQPLINKQQQIAQKKSNKEQQSIAKQKLQIDISSSSDIDPPKVVKPVSKSTTVTQIQKRPQLVEIRKQPIIKKVSSSEESSSEDLPIIKKPQNQNKLNISIKSPQEELKSKQEDWKQTFQKSKAQSQVEQKKGQYKRDQLQQSAKIRQVQDSSFVNQENYIQVDLEILSTKPELLMEQDKIKFKYIYFDAFRMQVAISDAQTGKVIRNNAEQKQIIIQTNKELKLSYSELKYLEIDTSTMTQERIQQLQKKDTENGTQNPQAKQQENNVNSIEEKQIINSDIPDPFAIGAQINYYFTDKNYKKDEYILQHTAKHPQKYMLLNLFLNFPKVKRVITEEEKLIQIVNQFIQKSKPQEIEFEIMTDADGNNWIRKKQ